MRHRKNLRIIVVNPKQVMRNIISLASLILLNACFQSDDRKKEVFITDPDYVEFERLVSPDGSALLLNYGIDLGAFGYGRAGTAILNLYDTMKNLRQFTLPNTLTDARWIDDSTVSAKFNIIPSIRMGKNIVLKDTFINGINVLLNPENDATDSLLVVHREISPNGKLELIAYRYVGKGDQFTPIHVSIVSPGADIPKYGNYYIGEKESDYVLGSSWSKENDVIFYSNTQFNGMIEYYFVWNRPEINYSVIVNDSKYRGKYLWSH